MKNFFLLVTLSFFISSCSDDTSESDNQDERFKIFFANDGSGTILGDKSNNLIKRIYSDTADRTADFYFNITTKDFYYRHQFGSPARWEFRKANALDVLNNTSYSYQTTAIPIITYDEEFLLKAIIDKSEQIHIVVRAPNDIGSSRLVYRKIINSAVVKEVDLTATFNLRDYSSSYNPIVARNELYIIESNVDNYRIVRLEMDSDVMETFELPARLDIGSLISVNDQIYIVSLNPNNMWYDLEGNEILATSVSLFGASIGYDAVDNQFEYVLLSDRRNEVGDIDLNTGEVEFAYVVLEAGDNSSGLYFFNK